MTQALIPQIVGPFEPEATTCGELGVGDLAVFDAMFGAERVLERTEHYVGSIPVPGIKPFVPPSSYADGWRFVHLRLSYQVADDHNTRYVFRAMHEPITRWRPIS